MSLFKKKKTEHKHEYNDLIDITAKRHNMTRDEYIMYMWKSLNGIEIKEEDAKPD